MSSLIGRVRRARGTWTVAAQQWRHDLVGRVEFIHLNKTGGSSIEGALGLPFSHQTALDRVGRLGVEEWNRRFSFTFVRNPWDRLVSQYHYRSGRGKLRSELDFREWVNATLVERDEAVRGWSKMFMTQADRICSGDSQLLVDQVFRFEHFQTDFARLCEEVGVTATLSHRKPSLHTHYSAYYDSWSKSVVADVFEKDVHMFGYSFERR